MESRLPEALYSRRKFACMAPPGSADETKRGRMQALCATCLNRPVVAGLGFFDSGAIAG